MYGLGFGAGFTGLMGFWKVFRFFSANMVKRASV